MRKCDAVMFSYGWVHPTIVARRKLNHLFMNIPSVSIIAHPPLKDFAAEPYQHADLWIFYFHQQHITQTQLNAIQRYLSTGGKILAIHSASASFKSSPVYETILGGRFISHGKIADYQLAPSPHANAVYQQTTTNIRDELYRHRYDNACRIQMVTEVDGIPEPVLWFRDHSPGCIAYFAPGHCSCTFLNPDIQTIIQKTVLTLMESCE